MARSLPVGLDDGRADLRASTTVSSGPDAGADGVGLARSDAGMEGLGRR